MAYKNKFNGQKFGRLLVIGPNYTLKHEEGIIYDFLCECGKQFSQVGRWIFKGKTRSCGCLHTRSDRRDAILKRMYDAKVTSASRISGIPTDILFEDFKDLSQQSFFYCGESPQKSFDDFNGRRLMSDTTVKCGGLDRINPSLGYILSNVRPCCEICNTGKLDYSEEEFFAGIKKIIEFQRKRAAEAALNQ